MQIQGQSWCTRTRHTQTNIGVVCQVLQLFMMGELLRPMPLTPCFLPFRFEPDLATDFLRGFVFDAKHIFQQLLAMK